MNAQVSLNKQWIFFKQTMDLILIERYETRSILMVGL